MKYFALEFKSHIYAKHGRVFADTYFFKNVCSAKLFTAKNLIQRIPLACTYLERYC